MKARRRVCSNGDALPEPAFPGLRPDALYATIGSVENMPV